MIRMLVPDIEFYPRYLVNAMPKSGLHLITTMLGGLCVEQPASHLYTDAWVGTFKAFSWSREWLPVPYTTYRLARLTPAHHMKGHVGHKTEIEAFMAYGGIGHVFIYRDLRDVAVSQAHHIMSRDEERHKHPDRVLYYMQGDGTFDDVLTAVIKGLGPYPGVLERWEDYAPWLDSKWALALRFEDVIADLRGTARQIIDYGLKHTIAPYRDVKLHVDEDKLEGALDDMVALANCKPLSPTYRSGKAGGWRKAFKPEHVELFKEFDTKGWIEELGYSWDDD